MCNFFRESRNRFVYKSVGGIFQRRCSYVRHVLQIDGNIQQVTNIKNDTPAKIARKVSFSDFIFVELILRILSACSTCFLLSGINHLGCHSKSGELDADRS